MPVHPAAIIDPAARIDPNADIGPYCIVGADVEIGARTRLMASVYLEGPLRIGEDNTFYPFSTVGVAPQDLKYNGERSRTEIGDRNRIREFVSIHRGTEGGGMVTSIGSDNLLMAYVHVAHDVCIGNRTVIANSVGIAGHVVVEDWAVLGANSGVHQFCRIGRHAITGAYSVIKQDVLPFSTTAAANDAKVYGANATGLERRGYSAATVEALQTSFRILTRSNLNTTQAVERIRAEVPGVAEVDELLDFIASSSRGFIK